MSYRIVLMCAVVAGLLASSASAQIFKTNNVFVTSTGDDRVYEYTRAGELERVFGPQSGLQQPKGLAFGPTGLLWVVSSGTSSLIPFNPLGLPQGEPRVIAEGQGSPSALAFGPDGLMFVLDPSARTVTAYTDEGTPVHEIELPEGDYTDSDLVFGPAGTLFLSDASAGAILVVSQRGTVIETLGEGDLTSPAGLAFGPLGQLIVADGNEVVALNAGGGVVGTLGGSGSSLSAARDVTVGPNSDLYVTDVGGNVIRYLPDGTEAQLIGDGEGGPVNPFAITFAPFRFLVEIKGELARLGQPLTTLKEKSGVVTVAPGSRTIMLAVTDDVTTLGDLASIFGSEAYVFHGFEVGRDDNAQKRVWQGTQVPVGAFEMGIASLTVRMSGHVKNQSMFEPTGGKGTLHRASGTGALAAHIKLKKKTK